MTKPEELTLRHEMVDYLAAWIGTPYTWGGDDFSGFDCSGLIHEVLQAHGLEDRGWDSNAHGLYLIHKQNKIEGMPQPGDLVFWFTDGKAKHVEMVYSVIPGFIFVIGASGGGSKTQTRNDAILHNAYVKKNLIDYRNPQPYKIVDLFRSGE